MNRRSLALPLLAVVAVLAVIGVQIAAGGTRFTPTPTADPCRERPLGPPTQDLPRLAEQLVLDGVQRAACTLGVSRERLILALPSAPDRRELARERGHDEQDVATALTGGLQASVTHMERAGRLPRASDLRDDYLAELGLPGIAEAAVRRIPDGIVDDLVPTGPVLRRALDQIDVLRILSELDDPDALEQRLQGAIKNAALEEVRARLVAKLPGPVRDLLP